MSLEPAPAIAFVQVDARTLACAEGPLAPASAPPPGGTAFLAPPFALDRAPEWWWSAGAPVCRTTFEQWSRRFPARPNGRLDLSWEPPEEGRFRAAFDSLQPLLRRGQLVKGVPVTRMRARVSAGEAEGLFRQLLARVPALPAGLMAYGLFLPAAGEQGPEFIVGATPELLFEALPGNRVRTQAVAGTRPVAAGAEGALAASDKDAAEHRAVVDDLLAQAGRWGSPHAGATSVRRFGTLLHLVTQIEVEASVAPGFEELVRVLHPTPALGVAPRGAAGTAWLRSIDAAGERRRFGAPFGVRWPSGEGRAVVAIRNVQYSNGSLEIWAGAGVVSASDAGAEWREILHKMEAVRTLWRL